MYHQLHLVAVVLGYILVAALFASLEIAPCRSSISGTRHISVEIGIWSS